MKITGNRGEWSELYALVELMHSGRLYAADENVNRINDIYFPILKILRKKDADTKIDYIIHDNEVDVLVDGVKVSTLSKNYLDRTKLLIYNGILAGTDRAFEINGVPEAMEDMQIDKIKASSADKADIIMQIHDIHTGYEPICGFSIKSELGNPPTLLNASGATNFVYEVKGITDEDMGRINAIDSRNKILDRISAISEIGEMKFIHAINDNFSSNLMLIDSYMEDIIAVMLLDYYQDKGASCRKLVDLVEDKNPLGYPRKGFYEYKFKKFLCSVALGMMPSKEWDGQDEANGGYVIVKEDGDVLAYHIYNRGAFETYLLNNTKLERGSTSRHGFASIYKDNGKYYINLNLQIRFT
jgi:hypothetical protein